VERWRRTIEAGLRRDPDAAMSVYAPDAVWDASLSGVGSFEGVIANRSFAEDWIGGYDDYEHEHEEAQDIGGGVVFAVARVDGRPAGSAGRNRTAFIGRSPPGQHVRRSRFLSSLLLVWNQPPANHQLGRGSDHAERAPG
jgi:hypothetical protein